MRYIFSINFLFTIYFNLKYFKLSDAIKLPVLFFGRVSIHALKGKVVLHKIRPGIIKIGTSSVGIFPRKLPTVLNIHGTLHFKGSANIGKGSALSIGSGSSLVLGDHFKITAKSSLISSGGKDIIIGDNCLMSWDIVIMNTDFHQIMSPATGSILNDPDEVSIGNKVWIGFGTTILKGSAIADGVVVAAKSLVNTRLEGENAIYGGVPAKLLKENISWKI